jgi:tetratricopeptide (TPR) repeat protein
MMAKRTEYVRKSVKEVLDDLLVGHREAAFNGPEGALKYLRRTFEGQANLPLAVRSVAYDLLAEAQAQLGDWEGCSASVAAALSHLEAAEAEFPHGYRAILEGLTAFERGIQAHAELGEFHQAHALAERAVSLGLGAHFQAKADSFAWAR